MRKKMKKVLKSIGKVATAPLKWAGGQIVKEMKMNKAKDDRYRAEGAKQNADYSGLQMLKRGMEGKRK
jgi:hypothetical protein